jgi:hypothetical protein
MAIGHECGSARRRVGSGGSSTRRDLARSTCSRWRTWHCGHACDSDQGRCSPRHSRACAFFLAYRCQSAERDGPPKRRCPLDVASDQSAGVGVTLRGATDSIRGARQLLVVGRCTNRCVVETPHREINFAPVTPLSLTWRRASFSNCGVQVCRSLRPAKRESGVIRHSDGEPNPELPPQLSAESPCPTCHWTLRMQSLGRRRGAETREPGDLPERSHPSGVRGARMGRSSAAMTGLVTRTEGPPCDVVFNVSESSAVRPSRSWLV